MENPQSQTLVDNTASTSSTEFSDVKVFLPPENQDGSSRQELPESYFQPTAGELQSAYQSQVKSREKLIGGPLRTGVVKEREAEEIRKRNRYPQTRIRIRFSNRTQVEKTFPTPSQLPQIYNFVKSILSEDVKEKPFVLYVTPPRKELRLQDTKLKGQTLYDLQLVPSAVINIKFEDEELNSLTNPPPIHESLLSRAEELPKPPVIVPTEAELADKTDKSKSSEGSKAPKWLKGFTKASNKK